MYLGLEKSGIKTSHGKNTVSLTNVAEVDLQKTFQAQYFLYVKRNKTKKNLVS